jgi:hypothetical protein
MIIKSPFDIINILGTSNYNEVSNLDKKRHFFIINRMLSRTLPDVAIGLGHLNSVPESGVDFWNKVFVELDSTPRGKQILDIIKRNLRISMSTDKKSITNNKIDKELAIKYMQLSKISPKDFEILNKFYQDDVIKYLKEFDKMIKTSK